MKRKKKKKRAKKNQGREVEVVVVAKREDVPWFIEVYLSKVEYDFDIISHFKRRLIIHVHGKNL